MIKPLPEKHISAIYRIDTEGYMKTAMNALLIIAEEQVVLMDPGCADFLPSRLIQEYGLEIPVPLEEKIGHLGYSAESITDVIFTHLHFDHGSGAFRRVPGKIVKRFPNARYHVLKAHYEYAKHPNPKESNSFFTSFLRYLDTIHWLEEWDREFIDFRIFNGHTRGMVVPVIKTPEVDTYYVTDLIPLELFLKSGVHSGYDLNPELAMREKQEFLKELDKSSRLIFFHDPLKESVFYP